MILSDLAANDSFLTLIAGIACALWIFLRSTEWFQQKHARKFDIALQALEAGVEQTYRTYVRAIKAARADGKLTDDEIHRARSLALHTAIDLAAAAGLDLIRELGDPFVELWLSKTVARLKK